MRLVILLALLFSLSSLAQEVLEYGQSPLYDKSIFNEKVQAIRSDDKIVLHGKTCDVLKKEAESLQEWSKKKSPSSMTCQCKDKVCSLDVTAIVPTLVAEKQGYCPANKGPNCFNGALVVSGILSNLRYTSGDEMNFWMDSPLCQERRAGEARKPGDIIAIRSDDGKEVHGFVHVSENLSFSKNGSSVFPYSLQSPENVYEAYQVEKGCEKFDSTKSSELNCKNRAQAFSCISMDEYLKKHPIKSEQLLETWKAIDSLDCSISSMAFSKTLDANLLDLTSVSLRSIMSLAEKKLDSAQNEDEKLIWKGIYIKANSNYDQYLLLKY